jgi:hypothetical protein
MGMYIATESRDFHFVPLMKYGETGYLTWLQLVCTPTHATELQSRNKGATL